MIQSGYIHTPGAIRAIPAESTLARLTPKLQQFGITRLAALTDLDSIGIPVYAAIRPNSKSLSVSQGKGLDKNLAKVSALMEAIEMWHAENITEFPQAVSIEQIDMSYLHPKFSIDSFDNTKLNCLTGHDLFSKNQIPIPQASLSLDTTKLDKYSLLFTMSSNGLASGNTIDEALLHGLYEVIERDCYAKWVYSGGPQSQHSLNINTIEYHSVKILIKNIQDANSDILIWQMDHPTLNISCFHCRIYDHNQASFAGTGCHLSTEVAINRAITEAAQSRLTAMSGARDDIDPQLYQNNFNNTLSDHKKINLKYNRTTPTGSFSKDLNLVLELLNSNNYHKAYYYNYTQDNINIPVIKAFIPGMKFLGHDKCKA